MHFQLKGKQLCQIVKGLAIVYLASGSSISVPTNCAFAGSSDTKQLTKKLA
jgi:hypothetical protein